MKHNRIGKPLLLDGPITSISLNGDNLPVDICLIWSGRPLEIIFMERAVYELAGR